MKYLLVLVLLVPCFIYAQTTTPPAQTQTSEANVGVHFEVSTSYERLMSGANATVVSAALPLTPRYKFVYSQYQIPSAKAQIYFGEVELREILSHIIKSSASQVNLDAIQVFVRAGAGTKRDDQGNNPVFSYGAHAGADVKIGQIGGGTLSVGLKVGFIRVPFQHVGPKVFVLGTTGEIAPGMSIRF